MIRKKLKKRLLDLILPNLFGFRTEVGRMLHDEVHIITRLRILRHFHNGQWEHRMAIRMAIRQGVGRVLDEKRQG